MTTGSRLARLLCRLFGHRVFDTVVRSDGGVHVSCHRCGGNIIHMMSMAEAQERELERMWKAKR